VTDYVTLNGWNFDAPMWSAKTYSSGQSVKTVTSGVYRTYYAAPDGDGFCTSTVAPAFTGSVTTPNTLSDGCKWAIWGDVTYSSNASYIPWNTYPQSNRTQQLSRPYTANLWNDREYLLGSNGESSFFGIWSHLGGGPIGGGEGGYRACVGPAITDCPVLTITTADGEGFAANVTTSTPLTGYDPTKGVALRAPSGGPSIDGLFAGDFFTTINGLQVKNEAGDGIFGGNKLIITNNIVDGGSPGVGTNTAINGDVPVIVANNLVISHAALGVSIKYGNAFVLFNTIVNAGSEANSVCISQAWGWTWGNQVAANNACYNWHHFGSFVTNEAQGNPGYLGGFELTSSKNNVTDTPSPDGNSRTVTFTNGSANIAWPNTLTAGTQVLLQTTGTLPTNFSQGTYYFVIATGLSGSNVQLSATLGGSAIVAGSAGSGVHNAMVADNVPNWSALTGGTIVTVPNSTYGASGASMFVSPGSDWRPGAALIGAGASYGTFSWGCPFSDTCTPVSKNLDTPDLLGNSRPTVSQWTVGAEQFGGTPPPYTLTGITLSGSAFTYSCAPSTVIGHIGVPATGGTFSSALSLTSVGGGFQLSSTSIPSDLIANASTGCPSSGGPYTLNIVATDGTAVGSPLTQGETLTGSGGSPAFLRVGGMLRMQH
jgi:hypothetical protein